MTKIHTCLIFIFLTSQVNAQYIEYHNLMNEANKYRYKKDYNESLKLFQVGFSLVEYVHSKNYAKAAMTAAKLKNFELVHLYLSKCIEVGYPISFVDSKSFRKFRKSKYFEGFRNELKHLIRKSKNRFNVSYKRQIDSLHFIDQKIIRGNQKVTTKFKIDPNLTYSDSSNFECLLKLIDRYGFPSEQELGYQGYRKSWVIIHHSARLIENHSYHSVLLEYVKSGDYLPENYCWVVDQGQELLKKELIYHHWDVTKEIADLTTKEKDEIDLKRKAVGLASVRRIAIVKGKNRVDW